MTGKPQWLPVVETVSVGNGIGVHIDEDGHIWIGNSEGKRCFTPDNLRAIADRAEEARVES